MWDSPLYLYMKIPFGIGAAILIQCDSNFYFATDAYGLAYL